MALRPRNSVAQSNSPMTAVCKRVADLAITHFFLARAHSRSGCQSGVASRATLRYCPAEGRWRAQGRRTETPCLTCGLFSGKPACNQRCNRWCIRHQCGRSSGGVRKGAPTGSIQREKCPRQSHLTWRGRCGRLESSCDQSHYLCRLMPGQRKTTSELRVLPL
jgi:hypothetical protein